VAKPRSIIRPISLRTTFPEDTRAKLDLYLWSELEGRVPQGAYQRFLVARIREFFEDANLDIGPWLEPTSPPMIVRGSPLTIDALASWLDFKKGPVAPPPHYQVQCRCGWAGSTKELKSLPDFKQGCPICKQEFKAPEL
jgi:hypothetical protein